MNTRSSTKTKNNSNAAAANSVAQKKANNNQSNNIADNRASNAAIQMNQESLNSQSSAPIQKISATDLESLDGDQKAAYQSLKHQGQDDADITMSRIVETAATLKGQA